MTALHKRLFYSRPVFWATSWIVVWNHRLYRAYDNFVIDYVYALRPFRKDPRFYRP